MNSMIKLTDLGFGYKTTLAKIDSLEIFPSEICFVFGANGSGKSTFLKTLAGLLTPVTGQLTYNLAPAYMPSLSNVQTGVSGHDIMDLMNTKKSKWRNNLIFEKLNSNELMNKSIEKLSSGEAQRVVLSAVLSHESDLVLLDEPLNFLDLQYTFALKELILQQRASGRSFLIITHDLSWASGFENSMSLVLDKNSFSEKKKTEEILLGEEIRNALSIQSRLVVDPLTGAKILVLERGSNTDVQHRS